MIQQQKVIIKNYRYMPFTCNLFDGLKSNILAWLWKGKAINSPYLRNQFLLSLQKFTLEGGVIDFMI